MNAVARLLMVISVVAALAASTPVACVCPLDQHGGQPLHPLFAHTHADAPSPAEAELTPDEGVAAVGWSAASASGIPAAAAGLAALPPLQPATLFSAIGDRVQVGSLLLGEYVSDPSSPPPRLTAT